MCVSVCVCECVRACVSVCPIHCRHFPGLMNFRPSCINVPYPIGHLFSLAFAWLFD
ncbi:hypothetical protein BGZ63DRAFT_375269 [Mariannaea sp. PMI_226]|nr:hypothetical protein BGZ63DRAFT_375269 [Mariannaea sp. PMI_226]